MGKKPGFEEVAVIAKKTLVMNMWRDWWLLKELRDRQVLVQESVISRKGHYTKLFISGKKEGIKS